MVEILDLRPCLPVDPLRQTLRSCRFYALTNSTLKRGTERGRRKYHQKPRPQRIPATLFLTTTASEVKVLRQVFGLPVLPLVISILLTGEVRRLSLTSRSP